MNKLLAILTLSASALTSTAWGQKTGDTVTPEALQKLEWVQGQAPAAWEPGKLYILECWATWCGPCVAAIPHVDALYDKYESKGLRVIGVNVWEDGKDKVEAFLKKKGDGMSYPVAYTGKGGVFETEWLKPAGVAGIPYAFLVKDGKVITNSHPAALTEELIESLLAGGDAEKAVLDKLNGAAAKQKAIADAKMAWTVARKANDATAMTAAADKLAEVDPESIYVPLFRNEALVAAKNWTAIDTVIDGLNSENKLRLMLLNSLGNTLSAAEGVPATTLTKATTGYEAIVTERGKKTTVDAMVLARLYFALGNKEKAIDEANQALELVKSDAALTPRVTAPYEQFAAAVAAGTMPTNEEFSKWFAAAPRPATATKRTETTKPVEATDTVKPADTK